MYLLNYLLQYIQHITQYSTNSDKGLNFPYMFRFILLFLRGTICTFLDVWTFLLRMARIGRNVQGQILIVFCCVLCYCVCCERWIFCNVCTYLFTSSLACDHHSLTSASVRTTVQTDLSSDFFLHLLTPIDFISFYSLAT
jgi:hypothetical protein